MPRRCRGDYGLLVPIRPIALTLCDIYGLAWQNRLVAVGLTVIAGLLLLVAYQVATALESSAVELLYRAIQAYLSRKATGMLTQGALHLAVSNLTFLLFRIGAYLVLRAAYDLGRDVVFALGLLVMIALLAVLLAELLQVKGWPTPVGSHHVAAAAIPFAAVVSWFWVRYISENNPRHRSFDFDVGAALVRLRKM